MNENNPIFGYKIYSQESSICRAAIHAGIISDEGGKVDIGLEPGRSVYEGVEKNSVKSTASQKKQEISFSISKYVPFCPIDDYPKVKKSLGMFLEVKEKSSLRHKSRLSQKS
jgi:hypothetical protein